MRAIKIIFSILAVVAVIMFSFIGCKQTAPEATEAGETTAVATTAGTAETDTAAAETTSVNAGNPIENLIVGVTDDMVILDQMSETGATGLMMKQFLYNGLVEKDADGNIIPGLAEKWTVSEDGKEYTFNLRKGVKFHNDRELKAEDVKFSIERIKDPNVASIFVGNFSHVTNIEIVDDYTVKFVLDASYAPFLSGIATGNIPIVAKESYDADNKLVTPIGTGPYKYVEWIADDHFTLAAFDGYWAGKPTVNQITFKVIPDGTVRLTALKTGEADIIIDPPAQELTAEMQAPSSTDFKLDIVQGSVKLSEAFTMNIKNKPFDQLKVRQAVSMLLDPQEIVTTVFKGVGTVCSGLYGEGNPWFVDVPRPAVDVDGAKALLEEAGLADGFEFDLSTTNVWDFDKVAEVVQAQLAKAGIKANITVDEFAAYADKQAKGEFDAQLVASDYGVFPDPEQWYSLLLKTGNPYPAWYGNYSNPEIDKLLDEAVTATDLTKRQDLYKQVAQIVWQDLPLVWLQQVPMGVGYRTDLVGIENAFAKRVDLIFDTNKGIGWLTR